MTTTELIRLDNGYAEGTMVPALAGEGHANLLVIRCARGFLMCGYLSLEKQSSSAMQPCVSQGRASMRSSRTRSPA